MAQVLKESAPQEVPRFESKIHKLPPIIQAKSEAQIKAGDKFRTRMCKWGKNCNRKKECGFAHHESQLRS
jgi:hypothetical protein